MKLMKVSSILISAVLATSIGEAMVPAKAASPVIELVTLKLKDGVSAAQFKSVDQDIQANYISKRPGFLSRESAPGANHTWLVIVHWRSVADADASMKSFSTAPASKQFMSMIVPGSMVMSLYGWSRGYIK
jgi:hypothetical protein